MTKTKTVNTAESSVRRGSGNVFGDIELPDADSHLLTEIDDAQELVTDAGLPAFLPPLSIVVHLT